MLFTGSPPGTVIGQEKASKIKHQRVSSENRPSGDNIARILETLIAKRNAATKIFTNQRQPSSNSDFKN